MRNLLAGKVLTGHRRVEDAGKDGIDQDIALREIDRRRHHETLQCRLGDHVREFAHACDALPHRAHNAEPCIVGNAIRFYEARRLSATNRTLASYNARCRSTSKSTMLSL